ncbi:hypothetical protein [Salibacterium aidingense]|uniref:hypothetical protein n=1 Tax=Salibacterium aidingense TaxID=384933 RepID=UPI0003FD7686|nr:hypothetical protein [Salibacterium aidingense]
MEEKFESFFYHQGPFYPMQVSAFDPWKQSVQEVVNDVIEQVLVHSLEERSSSLLVDLFKSTWFSRMEPGWYRYETSYYLWLMHVSGLLLPSLEQEAGILSGWFQYRPPLQAGGALTLPIIKEADRLKLYLFESDPVVLSQTAEAMALNASYSSAVLPELLQMESVEDGRSSIHTLSHTHKRKQDW